MHLGRGVRDWLLAASAANICLLRVWTDLLWYEPDAAFFFRQLPDARQYHAALANLILLTGVWWLAIRLLRRLLAAGHTGAGALMMILLSILPLNAIRSVVSILLPLLRSTLFTAVGIRAATLLIAVSIAGILVVFYMARRTLPSLAASILITVSPLVLLNAGNAVLRISRPRVRLDPNLGPAVRLPPVSPGVRAVWIIFDALDYRLAFPDRAAALELPEFDRLRKESLFATQAVSPADDTLPSVPSLLRGRVAEGFRTIGSSKLELRDPGSSVWLNWDGQDTVFAAARGMGLNSAVSGFYIPYCRLLNDQLTDCFWFSIGTSLNAQGRDFATAAESQLRGLFETSLLSPFGQSLLVKRRIVAVGDIHNAARRMVADPGVSLVFVHYPTPHGPHPYDRFKRDFTKANAPFSGYIDSLALADRLLGQLRADMTAAGLWDRSLVLVSSDHPFRDARMVDGKPGKYVPFILKLPGSASSLEYNHPMQTVASRRLVEAALRGELRTMGEAVRLIESVPQ